MTTPRSQQVHPDITPYYHCTSRCVRRSYLCGKDSVTGQSYEHRRDWVEQRICKLASIYCIDVCAYAVMSNHYHVVIGINKNKALELSNQEVVDRWGVEHEIPYIIQQFIVGGLSCQAEYDACASVIEEWRNRLYSLSWFMKELNYLIALQSNKEDSCTGRFWEGRFKSQAVDGPEALLTTMAYVDLNPVRAQMAETPEQSAHTSIKARIDALRLSQPSHEHLVDFVGENSDENQCGIPFRLIDYFNLVDWVGRQLRAGKSGVIDKNKPQILDRISLLEHDCLNLCTNLGKKQVNWIGSAERLEFVRKKLERQRMRCMKVHI